MKVSSMKWMSTGLNMTSDATVCLENARTEMEKVREQLAKVPKRRRRTQRHLVEMLEALINRTAHFEAMIRNGEGK